MKNQEKKYLTIGQLKDVLNEIVNDDNKDIPIAIRSKPLSGKAYIGPSPCTICLPFAGLGFDWDDGKFFVFPIEDLFFNDVDKKF